MTVPSSDLVLNSHVSPAVSMAGPHAKCSFKPVPGCAWVLRLALACSDMLKVANIK